jgi:hypothetical protein
MGERLLKGLAARSALRRIGRTTWVVWNLIDFAVFQPAHLDCAAGALAASETSAAAVDSAGWPGSMTVAALSVCGVDLLYCTRRSRACGRFRTAVCPAGISASGDPVKGAAGGVIGLIALQTFSMNTLVSIEFQRMNRRHAWRISSGRSRRCRKCRFRSPDQTGRADLNIASGLPLDSVSHW